MLIVPGIIIPSIDDGFSKFAQMRGLTGDCWENSKHERVCTVPTEGAKLANCKFWRNSVIKKHYYSWQDIEDMCTNIVKQMYAEQLYILIILLDLQEAEISATISVIC